MDFDEFTLGFSNENTSISLAKHFFKFSGKKYVIKNIIKPPPKTIENIVAIMGTTTLQYLQDLHSQTFCKQRKQYLHPKNTPSPSCS
mmetsp:Transcript_72794/g.89281  ORF Transcript_72794/g.89281 Transcript_72794/m.89281 type:complete len:87 (+) Transcript_72794:169-429(+)